MPEQIIIRIVRPNVEVEYKPESLEAEMADNLAASELALHALARHVRNLQEMMGRVCPPEVKNLVDSDTWRSGM